MRQEAALHMGEQGQEWAVVQGVERLHVIAIFSDRDEAEIFAAALRRKGRRARVEPKPPEPVTD